MEKKTEELKLNSRLRKCKMKQLLQRGLMNAAEANATGVVY